MKRFLLPLALGLALLAGPAAAANDMFLKIGDIKGESTDRDHRDWIDAYSFSWGVSNTQSASGGGGGAGKALFSDLSWMQRVDASTVPIFIGVASGTHYETAKLDVVRVGERTSAPFFQMVFEDATLSSLQLSGSVGGDDPFASASMQAGKITMNYRPQDPKGGLGAVITATWDLRSNSFSGDPQALTGLFLSGGTINAIGDLPLSPVPEAQSWLLLLLGLAVLGWPAARRARQPRGG